MQDAFQDVKREGTAARRKGPERMDQVNYAVLERNAHISIIPSETSAGVGKRATGRVTRRHFTRA